MFCEDTVKHDLLKPDSIIKYAEKTPVSQRMDRTVDTEEKVRKYPNISEIFGDNADLASVASQQPVSGMVSVSKEEIL